MTKLRSLGAAQTVPVRGAVDENIEQHIRLVRTAADEGVQLLVFPELSLTGYELDLAGRAGLFRRRRTPVTVDRRGERRYPEALVDLIAELVGAASKLGARLHPTSATSLADLVRVMNCYYSNLIEGHNTRPYDIERALLNDLDPNDERRDLQLEARVHIRVQRFGIRSSKIGNTEGSRALALFREKRGRAVSPSVRCTARWRLVRACDRRRARHRALPRRGTRYGERSLAGALEQNTGGR